MPEERVLVTGAGTIGLLTVFVLRSYGVRTVDVIEPEPERRELALRLGADAAVDIREGRELSDAYPVCVECSAHDKAFGLAQRKAAREGRLCLLSDGNREPLALAPEFHEKELSVVASGDGWDYRRHPEWFFGITAQGGAKDLEAIFDTEISANELPTTFERMFNGQRPPIKVLVRY
ncbi:MAG: zinc-binding dehydrogenase [Rubrobacteraceae bacterium]